MGSFTATDRLSSSDSYSRAPSGDLDKASSSLHGQRRKLLAL